MVVYLDRSCLKAETEEYWLLRLEVSERASSGILLLFIAEASETISNGIMAEVSESASRG